MTIRWGIIGCGDVVRKRIARAIIEDPSSELVAACRRDELELVKFCQKFQVAGAYRSHDELLRDSSVDAVYIATPVSGHRDQTIDAAAAGKHVLVEKPMAMNVRQCDEMIHACREHGVVLGVAYYRRFYPLVQRLRELMAGGTIGSLLSVSATTSCPLFENQTFDGYWRVDPAVSGGGPLMDVGSHRIDLFLDLLGDIDDARAHVSNPTADYGTEQIATVSLQFRSGQLGTLQCCFGTSTDRDEFSLLGSAGALDVPCLNGDTLIIRQGNESTTEIHAPPENLCAPLIADFVEAISLKREPRVSGETGRETNRIVAMAYESAGS